MIPSDEPVSIPRLYAEKNLWSQKNNLWSQYEVKKPRLPTTKELESGDRWRDDDTLWPTSFRFFLGDQNEEVVKSLTKVAEEFEVNKTLPNSMIIYVRVMDTYILYGIGLNLKYLFI